MANPTATVTIICPQCSEARTVLAHRHKYTQRRAGYRGGLCRRCATGNNSRTHGETKSRLYRCWNSMRARGRGTAGKRINALYYDRGIRVCPEWDTSYEAFRDWALANGYADDLELDRRDNDGSYEPVNCRWATTSEQAQNRRHVCKHSRETVDRIRQMLADGLPYRQIAEAAGVKRSYVKELARHRSRIHSPKLECYTKG